MSQKDHLKLTREELYEVVWSKPMTEVGHDFHVSDRAMAKLCARMQVPVPPRGYWAKKAVGKTVAQPPLPDFVAKQPKTRKARQKPEELTAEKLKQPSVIDERSQRIKVALKQFRKPLSEAVNYTVRIDGWRCDYSFGLNPSFDPLHRDEGRFFLRESPYIEHRDLVLRGVLLEPARLKQKGFEARFTRDAYSGRCGPVIPLGVGH